MSSRGITVILALLLAIGASACPSPPVEPQMSWPDPPAEARVVWEEEFHGSLDLERSFFGKVRDFFLGAAEPVALQRPWGITLDHRGRIYLADTGAHAVVMVDRGAGILRRWDSLGPHGKLGDPINVLVVEEELYVLDSATGRVAILDLDGGFRRFLFPDRQFESPVGIAWDRATDLLYLVDSRAHEIVIVTRDGQIRDRWGGRGDGPGQFHYPLGIAIHPNGLVYVVDSFHFSVQVFDRAGEFQFSFGATAEAIGSMLRPRDLAIDSAGNLYVTDAMAQDFKIYSPEGALLLRVGSEGMGKGQFRLPAGIWIDPQDRIHLVDSINQRVQRFRYLAESNQEEQR